MANEQRHPLKYENPLCAQIGSEAFFVEGKGEMYSKTAIATCNACQHRIECAEYAIPIYNLDGLWGGLTPKRRADIRRERGIAGISVLEGLGQ